MLTNSKKDSVIVFRAFILILLCVCDGTFSSFQISLKTIVLQVFKFICAQYFLLCQKYHEAQNVFLRENVIEWNEMTLDFEASLMNTNANMRYNWGRLFSL